MNENYIPLYRKYRPQTLDEIVGQEHIKRALANAINLNKIAHAYFFTGPRGTGKTSSARILAKSLNCKNGPTLNPCGKCESCMDITNSIPIDVIEIDAASNRKVEDARNILEKIQYTPVNGKYKIYIIDEVHMLTTEAFNTLLKTLEEPPENVVFILATTEPHKVLDTIKSRCQRFDFKRITTKDIVNHLRFIADKEKINIEEDALMTIAKNSAGGMRDSIALLDQLSVLDNSRAVTTEDINLLLGRLSFDVLKDLVQNIINLKPNESLKVLEDVYSSGNEPSQILLNLLNYFKNMLIVKNCQNDIAVELTQLAENQIKEMEKQVKELESHQIIFLIEKTAEYIKELKTTTNPHLWLEVAIIDLSNLAENTKLIDLQNRISLLEGNGTAVISQQITYKTPPTPLMKPSMTLQTSTKSIDEKENNKVSQKETAIVEVKTESKSDVENIEISTKEKTEDNKKTSEIKINWQDLLDNISSPMTQAILRKAIPVEITSERVIITFKNDVFVKQVNDSNKKQMIIDAANNLFNQKNTNVIIRLQQAGDSAIQNTQKTEVVETSQNSEPKKKTEIIENAEEQDFSEAEEVQNAEDSSFEEVPSITDKIEIAENYSDQTQMVIDLFDGKAIN